jgi:hypothetical protein
VVAVDLWRETTNVNAAKKATKRMRGAERTGDMGNLLEVDKITGPKSFRRNTAIGVSTGASCTVDSGLATENYVGNA